MVLDTDRNHAIFRSVILSSFFTNITFFVTSLQNIPAPCCVQLCVFKLNKQRSLGKISDCSLHLTTLSDNNGHTPSSHRKKRHSKVTSSGLFCHCLGLPAAHGDNSEQGKKRGQELSLLKSTMNGLFIWIYTE